MGLLESLAGFLKLIHALSGVLFVTGLIGRWVAMSRAEQAARAADLHAARALLGAAGVFERMVIPSSMAVLLLGLLTAWGEGVPLLGFLRGSSANWLLVSLVLYLSIIPLVPLVFLKKGRAFEAAMEESVTQGRPTAGLVAAFADPTTRAAHGYELAVVLVVLVLMIAKPF
jgi:hypothetical protein